MRIGFDNAKYIEMQAARIRERINQFGGKLRISYSGGADYFNIGKIFDAGIWPITMATTILKPGGYQRMSQIAGLFKDCGSGAFSGVDVKKTEELAAYSKSDARYRKPLKPLPDRKNGEELPLLDCFFAPCRSNCPISQDIPAYLHAMEEGRAEDALQIILQRNALPLRARSVLIPAPTAACATTMKKACISGK